MNGHIRLGSRSYTRHGKTDVDGRTYTTEEKLSFQEDLSIGDRNDIGGNVSRHISTLGLNDGKRGEGTSAEFVAHLSSTLE